MIRCLNLVIVNYSLFAKSHPLENFFGHVRIMSYHYDSFDNFVRVIVETIMKMILRSRLEINQNIKSRINISELRLLTQMDHMTVMLERFNFFNVRALNFFVAIEVVSSVLNNS